MRKYELTYLISDIVPESDLNKVTGKINGYVTSLGGKILKEEIWGRRKLAYTIKKQDFATYVTINFDLPAEKVTELERDLILSSKIIRHLLLLKDFGEEVLSLTSEDIVDTEAIEEVVGGERSFETIVGETEESKDLMAVREQDEEKEEIKEEVETVETKETKEIEAKPEVETQTKEKIEAKTEKPTEEKKKVKKEKKTEADEKKPAKKADKAEVEADRLSKLDKELDDILGDQEL